MDQLATTRSDELLKLFLRSKDAADSDKLLTRLIQEYANPILIAIIRSKLRVSLSNSDGSTHNQDALEIAGDLRVTIFAELQKLKSGTDGKSINNFGGYVAVKTYSACADYFRAKNPERQRLADMLRHNLNTNPRLALWKDGSNRLACGLQSSYGRKLEHSERLRELLDGGASTFDRKPSSQIPTGDRLIAILEWVGHPIEFNQLVTIASVNLNGQPESHEPAREVTESPDLAVPIDKALEQRAYLQRLWSELTTLPLMQRTALLLNLRDARGGSAIVFLPYLGLVSKEQIAELLSMNVEEFSELWGELPLDDSRIASMLGISRQQVINLRKSGRQRLARRLMREKPNRAGNK